LSRLNFVKEIKAGVSLSTLVVWSCCLNCQICESLYFWGSSQRENQKYFFRDSLIRLGSGTTKTPYITLRLIEVRSGNTWHCYLTSVLDCKILPPYVVADLYRRLWRIEEAFNTLKSLLGLSYLWTGSLNGIQLQIWEGCFMLSGSI
jgi:hypothetical protein